VVPGYNEHGKAYSPFIKSMELLCQLKEIKYFGLWTQVMAQNMGVVPGCNERGNEHSPSIKSRELMYHLRICYLLKKDLTSWCSLDPNQFL